jgi:hypothetical protein
MVLMIVYGENMESLNGYTKVTHVWEIGRREISPTINLKKMGDRRND